MQRAELWCVTPALQGSTPAHLGGANQNVVRQVGPIVDGRGLARSLELEVDDELYTFIRDVVVRQPFVRLKFTRMRVVVLDATVRELDRISNDLTDHAAESA